MNDFPVTDSIYSIDTYRYDLPPEMIAQYPAEPRDSSRLLVLDRNTGRLQDRVFNEVKYLLAAGDILVLNRTRVIPARLWGVKDTGAHIEILLLARKEGCWEALVKPARRMKVGSIVRFPGFEDVAAEVEAVLEGNGCRLLRFHNCPDMTSFLEQAGQVPLPPYIDRPAEPDDLVNYQTVYAREPGSAAAPTAGLHFTAGLLEEIRARGVQIVTVVLHVGLGTFRPVSSQDIREHRMHCESYYVSPETSAILNKNRAGGARIVAVGTTVVRTLESVYNAEAGFRSGSGQTDMFIYPGYRFKAIDGLITNFHLPGSSLLMLVGAFGGLDNTLAAYRHAVEGGYRFFSYGDAMLII
ncbi:MAG: tRNA preQ1(34) S-adenosylmethionine ribosyltransferase-isomerase QueA [Syntrophomonadaceae bacterium]